jgi:hypothetical protein
MSAQSFSNLANSEFNGNIVLTNPNSYIQFGNGSQQTTAGGGGGGGNVSTTTINTYTNTSTNNFEDAEITCATQDSTDNSYLVANTAFVQTNVQSVGILEHNCVGIGLGVLSNNTGTNNNAFGNTTLSLNTSGFSNCAFGSNSLGSSTTASNNTGYGNQTLTSLTSGNFNCAFGFQTLDQLITGENNLALGGQAGVYLNSNSSDNTLIGNQAGPINTDTTTYKFLTCIGSDSEPINVGSNNQIVLGRLNGDDELFIPSNNIFLGNQNNISETYTIEASGENSTIIFTAQDSVPTGYQNVLSLSTTLSELTSGQITFNGDVTINGDITIPSPNNLIINDVQFVNQGGDPSYPTNAVIYLNSSASVGEQLRVQINGTLYYINLTAV